MPRVTTIQTNFSGGELSPRMLGQVSSAIYQAAAALIENALPVVQGGVRKRDGTFYVNAAKATTNARLLPFLVDADTAYVLEFGDQYIRFYKDNVRVESPPGTPVEIAHPYPAANVDQVYYCQSADTMLFFHQSFAPQRLRRFSDTLWVWDTTPIDPIPFDEIGDSFATVVTLSLATVGAGRTATAAGSVFLNSDVGRTITYQGGIFTITGFTSGTVVTGTISTAFQSVTLPSGQWTLGGTPQSEITPSAKDPIGATITLTATGAALNTWRSSDVGKYVRIFGGLVKITGFTSALIVNARIVEVLAASTLSPPLSWQLLAAVWGGANGYPRCGCFYEQRLCVAGTPAQPQTIWGSSVGAYFDFTLSENDDDAWEYTLASDVSVPILGLASSSILVALTLGGEFTVKGGVEKPITPTNVSVRNKTNYGTAAVRPLRRAESVDFVQRSGRKLRGISYDESTDSYKAPDLTFSSEHVSKDPAASASGFTELAYAQEPDPTVWCRRADGVVASLTVSDDVPIVAWARQFTSNGTIESVTTIPVAGGDQTWFMVKRTISGATVQYVEVLDARVGTDCSTTLTNGTPQTVWGGLTWLEGQVVRAYVLDQNTWSLIDYGTFTVTGGTITLPHAVTRVQVGLSYTAKVAMLTPEIGTGTGSAQGNAMRTSEITVRIKDTAHLNATGNDGLSQLMTPKHFGTSLLDEPTPAITDTVRLENLGWDRGSSDLVFTSDAPCPFHILSVTRKLTVND